MKDKNLSDKGENKSFNILIYMIGFVLVLGGICMFFYPSISNFLAEKNQIKVIGNYEEIIESLDNNQLSYEFKKAKIYNENLAGDPVYDPFVGGSGYGLPSNYLELLNVNKDGVMGYIEIPKISVNLPIYHGTDNDVMEKGIGHIQVTSLPIGGISTHSILTGHTGLPSAELFTNLDKLSVGDIFYIKVLNNTLIYKIYDVKVILPNEISELKIEKGKDLVTLVTCTPYGVNTHRLLVKAERTSNSPYVNDSLNSSIELENKRYYLIGTIVGLIILLLLITLIIGSYRKGKI